MRENWKDYLAPGALTAGLLTLLIGVAVFGAPVYERETARSYVTEDTSQASFYSTNEEVDDLDWESLKTPSRIIVDETVPQTTEEEFREIQNRLIQERRQVPLNVPPQFTVSTREEPQKPLSVADIVTEPGGKALQMPESLEADVVCRWNCRLIALTKTVTSRDPEQVPELMKQWSDITENDGSFYYYACGFIHDRFARSSKEYRISNFSKAVDCFEKAVELDGDTAIYHHFLGMAHFYFARCENRPEFYDKAVPHYQAAEKCDPTWAMPVDAQGWCKFETKDYDGAIALLERALEIDDECVDAYCGLIRVYMDRYSNSSQMDVDSGLKVLEYVKAGNLALMKKNASQDECGCSYNFAGYARTVAGPLIDGGFVTRQTHPELFDSNVLNKLAAEAYQAKRYDDVIFYATLALSEQEDSVYYYSNCGNTATSTVFPRNCLIYRAVAQFERGEYREAVDDIQTYMARDDWERSHSIAWQRFYAVSLARLEKWEDVTAFYQDGSKHSTTRRIDPIDHMIRALALGKTGQEKRMLDVMETVKTNDSLYYYEVWREHIVFALDELSKAYAEVAYDVLSGNDRTSAARLIRQFNEIMDVLMEVNPRNYPRYDEIAKTSFLADRFEESATFTQRFLDFEPGNENALVRLLNCRQKQNNNTEIFQTASRLIALDPENPDYRLARAKSGWNYNRQTASPLVAHDLEKLSEIYADRGQRDQQLQALCWLGDYYKQNLRTFSEAVAYYEAALRLMENDDDFWEKTYPLFASDQIQNTCRTLLGNLSLLRKSDMAIKWCNVFLKNGADERVILELRARFYAENDQHQESVDDYMALIRCGLAESSDMQKWQLYSIAGRSNRSVMKPEKSLELLTEAVELLTEEIEKDPGNINPYNFRTFVYESIARLDIVDQEKYRELAEQDKQKVIELQKQNQ